MISDRLAGLLRGLLELPADFDFADATKAYEVPGWDSLKHAEVLVSVEQEYGIRFKALEAIRLKSVGDLQVLIDKKTAAPGK